MTKIHLDVVRVGELIDYEFQYRQRRWKEGVAPITPTRAQAQAHNPRSTPDDVGLIVAKHGDICIGHLSVIPAMLRLDSSRAEKIAWTSAFFVHPDYRKSIAAFQIMRKLTSLGQDIFVTGFNEPSRAICAAFGFQDFGPLHYLRIDLRPLDLSANAINRASRMFRMPVELRSTRFDYGLRCRFLGRCRSKLRTMFSNHRWDVVETVERTTRPQATNPGFARDVEAINWMLNYPWLRTTGPVSDPPYYFSDLRNEFEYIAISIVDVQGTSHGYAVFLFTEKDGKRILKTLDHDLPCESRPLLLDAAIHFAIKHRADQILLPESVDALVAALPLARLRSSKQRQYQWYAGRTKSAVAVLPNGVSSIQLQYADGDCAFG